MHSDAYVLRQLAYRYFEITCNSKNAENIKLHKAVNCALYRYWHFH